MGINQNIKKERKDKIGENYIIGYFEIKNNNRDQRIINSYENVKREKPEMKWDKIKCGENEEEIKKCEIYIDEKKIKFKYYYNFETKGKYII